MSALDDFEESIYYCLDEGIQLHELQDWISSFVEMWYEANGECREQCEPGACEDCDHFRVEEEPVPSEDEAALSQAEELLKALEECDCAGYDPVACVCPCHTDTETTAPDCQFCFGQGRPCNCDPIMDTLPVEVRETTMSERLDQVESLLNRLFDEVRNLKGNLAPEWPPKKVFPSGPFHPQQPYQPPQIIPYSPRTPLQPWATINNCSCLPHNGGSGVCHCVRPAQGPRY